MQLLGAEDAMALAVTQPSLIQRMSGLSNALNGPMTLQCISMQPDVTVNALDRVDAARLATLFADTETEHLSN